MGMDITGGMIVGTHGSNIVVPEGQEFYAYIEDLGLAQLSECYESAEAERYYGFQVPDVDIYKGRDAI